jgi:flagellar motor switch protein FliN/FliY
MPDQTPPGETPAPNPSQPPAAAPAPPAEASATPPPAEPAVATAAAEDAPIGQDAVDALLKEPQTEPAAAAEPAKPPTIDELLQQANFEDAAAVASEMPAPDAEAFKLPSFQQVMADAQVSSIDLLRDVELNVKIELGRSRMLVEDVLKLAEGSVVELDKLAGDPVDVFVNERLVARGEVLVLNDNFCVRVNEIVAGVKEEGL